MRAHPDRLPMLGRRRRCLGPQVVGQPRSMCRSIKTLRKRDVIASDDEIRAAARQFVRKISGFSEPSAKHQAAFEAAVDDVALASRRVLREIRKGLRARA